ncbi:S8 family serine peptidase [Nonomuraea guangzhouensis]|uniref:S8 family serine peptidase n=1 Tax=Nonomuraea guangzhouensis TaxID=1291555 RepID=A0ABW4GN81_9ACTN|nr:S8 family serine peptidase [Nonomuraea guangzhouensis]
MKQARMALPAFMVVVSAGTAAGGAAERSAVAEAEDDSGTDDRYGHGTHVADIVTGNGSAARGKYVGVAPDATLLNGKVLNDTGSGEFSWIVAGMEWAAERGADVVNMSLGSILHTDGKGPLDLAVNELTRRSGTLFVVAAGNEGPGNGSFRSPGAPRGQKPCQCGQQRPIGPVRSRPGDLTTQDGDLMTQHQDLHLLGGVAPRKERQPAEQPAAGTGGVRTRVLRMEGEVRCRGHVCSGGRQA